MRIANIEQTCLKLDKTSQDLNKRNHNSTKLSKKIQFVWRGDCESIYQSVTCHLDPLETTQCFSDHFRLSPKTVSYSDNGKPA